MEQKDKFHGLHVRLECYLHSTMCALYVSQNITENHSLIICSNIVMSHLIQFVMSYLYETLWFGLLQLILKIQGRELEAAWLTGVTSDLGNCVEGGTPHHYTKRSGSIRLSPTCAFVLIQHLHGISL